MEAWINSAVDLIEHGVRGIGRDRMFVVDVGHRLLLCATVKVDRIA
jgi:hypothetical protein